jgi:hypothetical protein
VFPSCWSVHGSRKVLLNKEVLILSGKKPNRSNVYVKNIFLISGIRFTYKFVIPYTKRGQKDFLEFLKYWPSSHGLNKLVIKAKMHANTYIVFLKFPLLCENMML